MWIEWQFDYIKITGEMQYRKHMGFMSDWGQTPLFFPFSPIIVIDARLLLVKMGGYPSGRGVAQINPFILEVSFLRVLYDGHSRIYVLKV